MCTCDQIQHTRTTSTTKLHGCLSCQAIILAFNSHTHNSMHSVCTHRPHTHHPHPYMLLNELFTSLLLRTSDSLYSCRFSTSCLSYMSLSLSYVSLSLRGKKGWDCVRFGVCVLGCVLGCKLFVDILCVCRYMYISCVCVFVWICLSRMYNSNKNHSQTHSQTHS